MEFNIRVVKDTIGSAPQVAVGSYYAVGEDTLIRVLDMYAHQPELAVYVEPVVDDESKHVFTKVLTAGDVIGDDSELLTDAMALWEWFLEDNDRLDELPDEGACARREYVATVLLPLVNHYYQRAITEYGYDEAYDWEFIPMLMSAVLNFDDTAATTWDETYRQVMGEYTYQNQRNNRRADTKHGRRVVVVPNSNAFELYFNNKNNTGEHGPFIGHIVRGNYGNPVFRAESDVSSYTMAEVNGILQRIQTEMNHDNRPFSLRFQSFS